MTNNFSKNKHNIHNLDPKHTHDNELYDKSNKEDKIDDNEEVDGKISL